MNDLQMSSNIYKLYENIYVRNAIHNDGMNLQEKISDFVRRIIHEKNLSYRKVADKSGGLITHSTVSDVVNGRVINLSSQTVSGLAKGLGVTDAEIFNLVRGKSPDKEIIANERFAKIAEGYGHLSNQEQKNLEPLVTAIELTIQGSVNLKGQIAPTIAKPNVQEYAGLHRNTKNVSKKGTKQAEEIISKIDSENATTDYGDFENPDSDLEEK